jgi:hypothetical protein
MIDILALIGFITIARTAYQARWIIDPASWKRGGPFLGIPWGLGGGK